MGAGLKGKKVTESESGANTFHISYVFFYYGALQSLLTVGRQLFKTSDLRRLVKRCPEHLGVPVIIY